MTDRIAELRALLTRLQTDENPYAQFEALLVAEESLPALLDCAEALQEIIDPISYMKRRLQDGERLNGVAALQLANDVEHLRGIARVALARLNGADNAG